MRLASPGHGQTFVIVGGMADGGAVDERLRHIAIMDVVDLSGQAGSPAVSVPSTSAATW